MRITALEEHLVLPELLEAWRHVMPASQQTPERGFGEEPLAQKLREYGDRRLADMDDQGVDVQVLSLNTPGVQNLAAADSVTLARGCNDALAAIVSGHPERFQAFAAVPTPAPDAAAAELERAVTKLGLRGAMLYGRTGTTNADAPEFDDLYGTAARLRAPLYFHPQRPPRPICKNYYSGFGEQADAAFSTFGLGWYYETGVQLLRMIFAGVFDRHPQLQVIIGHWGEVALFFLEHTAIMESSGLHLERPLLDYFRRNVWVTGSGLLSERYLRWTAEVVGYDRIMFSTDYPFIDTQQGKARHFLGSAPLTQAQQTAIAAGNWERLTAPLS